MKRDDRARRTARDAMTQAGSEVRAARLALDLSQSVAGRAIGMSASAWSRLERGAAEHLSIMDLARALAIFGLDLYVCVYSGGKPLRDQTHLELLDRLRARVSARARWLTEVPLPTPGDGRAWDALILLPDVRVGVVAETRGRDWLYLQQRLALKRHDSHVDHIVLLMADTRDNRKFLWLAGEGLLSDFPVPGDVALERLAVAEDPDGSAIILL